MTIVKKLKAQMISAVMGSVILCSVGVEAAKLPRLVDLGASACIPCKKLKPILDQLREEYRGRMEVVFIDVWQDPAQGKAYGIKMIPTQIFYDAAGKERFRHVGFISKEDILAQWKRLGVTFDLAVTTVEQRYPGLASGALAYAKLGQLPDGVLLRAGDVTVTAAELQKKVDCGPANLREQSAKNMFFMLEREAANKIVLILARRAFARTHADATGDTDKELIGKFLQDTVAAKVTVSPKELADYYANNRDVCGQATFDEAKSELKEYALQEKRQDAVNDYIRTLGQRVPITVSAAWVQTQVPLARDNAVDAARASGKVSVVDFGSHGCRPCDMMTPVLAALKKEFAGKANVLFVHVGQEEFLAARYHVQAIPVQVFFDKTGREVYRHLGFFPQKAIEAKLRAMGIE